MYREDFENTVERKKEFLVLMRMERPLKENYGKRKRNIMDVCTLKEVEHLHMAGFIGVSEIRGKQVISYIETHQLMGHQHGHRHG